MAEITKLMVLLVLANWANVVQCKRYDLFEDDFSDQKLFHEKWKTKDKTDFRYGGRRKEFKIKPGKHGRDAFIETEIKLHHHKKPPHIRIKAKIVRKGHCDNHYIVLRSESLVRNVPGQHPGVSLYSAGVGDVGGTWAHTGQIAFMGWKCDEKVLYVPGHKEHTSCSLHRECGIDITLNSTSIIFKDQCGCKTLRHEKYLFPRKKKLHLILGAHTFVGAAHGAAFKNIRVYSVDEAHEDDEELEEIDLEHHLFYHENKTVGKTGRVDEDDHETYHNLIRRRRVAAQLNAQIEDDGMSNY
ncbi:hypothetical protein MHBO_001824 [Bonamia ostreae]|uniref:Uncharacterized protein n=1 Tax=Bonamia ostreae TaxID=126728 RepID=A0ABV2AL38_9EUKA